LDISSEDSPSTTDSSGFSPPAKKPSLRNWQSLTNLALICDQFDVSDRAGAAIASVVLKDFGFIDDANTASVIDMSKLKQKRQKCRQILRQEEKCHFKTVDGIYPKIEMEEHYVVVGEPGETVDDDKDVIGAKAIHYALKNTDLINSLSAIGSDETAIMTGKHHGCITSERLLHRLYSGSHLFFACK